MRTRNRRGQGSKLRDEVLVAAVGILEESGRPEAVTLRAIARRIGIAPPSIYAHFADRDAIVAAIVSDAFDELTSELTTPAIDELPDSVDRLRAGCAAYLDFAELRPHRYQVLFQTPRPPNLDRDVAVEQMTGYKAFSVLVRRISDCAASGRSGSTDPFADATSVWVALHGYAMLRATVPTFPWPDRADFIDRTVLTLAGIAT